jgi:hypothetical protein
MGQNVRERTNELAEERQFRHVVSERLLTTFLCVAVFQIEHFAFSATPGLINSNKPIFNKRSLLEAICRGSKLFVISIVKALVGRDYKEH